MPVKTPGSYYRIGDEPIKNSNYPERRHKAHYVRCLSNLSQSSSLKQTMVSGDGNTLKQLLALGDDCLAVKFKPHGHEGAGK